MNEPCQKGLLRLVVFRHHGHEAGRDGRGNAVPPEVSRREPGRQGPAAKQLRQTRRDRDVLDANEPEERHRAVDRRHLARQAVEGGIDDAQHPQRQLGSAFDDIPDVLEGRIGIVGHPHDRHRYFRERRQVVGALDYRARNVGWGVKLYRHRPRPPVFTRVTGQALSTGVASVSPADKDWGRSAVARSATV
jgi:hypothetical protein